ncbi:hypothetical protein OAG71_04105 [bacterium]|nr:hypothetical protein [bacterium]
MKLPSERFQVDVQKYECHQFEQMLDDCLDDRDSISALVSNPHLQQCDECQNAYDVYRQFDSVGAAVLNGGARFENRSANLRRERLEFWRLMGAAVLTTSAAVLMLFVLASPPQGHGSSNIANNVNLPNLLEPAALGLVKDADASVAIESIDFASWNSDYISELRSAVGCEAQPAWERLREASEFSSVLVATQLAVPFKRVLPLGRLGDPWLYTSELPGIRPIHRSVKAGLVLYQDSVSLL